MEVKKYCVEYRFKNELVPHFKKNCTQKEANYEQALLQGIYKDKLEYCDIKEDGVMDKELAAEINRLRFEIEKKLEQYSLAQIRYNGDNALSHRLEGEIDSLDLQIKILKRGVFDEQVNN